MGVNLDIVEISEEIVSPHQRPLTGLLYEGWFTNLEAPILKDEKAPHATCICTEDPQWQSSYGGEPSTGPGTSNKNTQIKETGTKVKTKNIKPKTIPVSDMSSTDNNSENKMEVGAPTPATSK